MNDLIRMKFLALTSYEIDWLQNYVSHDKFAEYRKKYKIEDFRKRLIDYKMDEYIEPLFNYMIIVHFRRKLDFRMLASGFY